MTEHVALPTNPFETAMNKLAAFVNKKGRGQEAKEFLEYTLRRHCISEREREIARRIYEQTALPKAEL